MGAPADRLLDDAERTLVLLCHATFPVCCRFPRAVARTASRVVSVFTTEIHK